MLVVAQAVLFSASATADQVHKYIHTGVLKCRPPGAEPEPEPYDPDELKSLAANGKLG